MTKGTTRTTPTGDAKSGRPSNPLEPLASCTTLLLGLILVGLAIVVSATIFGSGSILGFGHSASICADTGDISSGSTTQSLAGQARAGVDLMTTGFHLCAAHPSTGQHFLYALEMLPGTVLSVGGVLLAYLLVRNAARNGIYTSAISGRLHVLGWFLLVGSLAQAVIAPIAATKLLDTMTTGRSSLLDVGPSYALPWPLLLTSVGVLSFARIMQIGVRMQEDLEGTV